MKKLYYKIISILSLSNIKHSIISFFVNHLIKDDSEIIQVIYERNKTFAKYKDLNNILDEIINNNLETTIYQLNLNINKDKIEEIKKYLQETKYDCLEEIIY